MSLGFKHLTPCQVVGCHQDSDGDATNVPIPGGLRALVSLCNQHREQYRAAVAATPPPTTS